MKKEILRMERVSYQEQNVMLLDGLSLNIFEGEILGLVPVNSFGVEALTKVLCHNLPLHYGYVYYKERLVNTWRHVSQITSQIMLIQNRSSLVPDLTVLENVQVLRSRFRNVIIHYRSLKEKFQELADKMEFFVEPDTYADDLTVYQRVMAELMKAVYLQSKLVILWDVSTFVSAYELKKLHKVMRQCTQEGMSFLYITPHLEETKELCQRTLCMYNGQIIKGLEKGQQWPALLPFDGNRQYENLVRSQIDQPSMPETSAAVMFEMRKIYSPSLSGLSFWVRKGECLVLQDMDGKITDELLLILRGRCPYQGEILVQGKPVYSDRSIAIVQEIATGSMLFPQLSYMDNLCFTLDHKIPKIWRSNRLRREIRRDLEPELEPGAFDKSISELTEKEKYTLLYTRIRMQHPDVVFCVRPFKGAEMETRMHICQQLEKLRKSGIAVVILAVNLADSLALADRVLQVRKGRNILQYLPENFGSLPDSTPWRRLYKEVKKSDSENRI